MHFPLVGVPCLLAAVLLVGGCSPGPAADHRRAVAVAPVAGAWPGPHDSVTDRALSVMHRWDDRRAAAYASGDVSRLRDLYVRGSVAGARDVRILREYAARGLVVEHLVMQVLRARVEVASRSRLRLHLVDRVAGGTARSWRSEVALPGGRPRSRTVTLVRVGGRWLVRSVRAGPAHGSVSGGQR